MKDIEVKIPVAEPFLGGNELNYVTECIKSNWISSSGEFVKKFEKGFADYCGVDHGISTSNGTTALHLALVALGVEKGDEVIIPNLTFISTANVVAYCGAKVILVDVEKETWNIDPIKIEEKITPQTKAIIPVHLYGHSCDMDSIMEIAKKHNLFVIEDCAEAHGAEYKGKKVGSFGDVGCFSFYGNKIITTGEGGMCVTNNEKLAERMNFLKNHGSSKEKRYWHPELGFNYRMTNIQAAIGLAQLEQIDKFIEIKRNNAFLYNSLLKNNFSVTLPPEKEQSKNVYWMYSILVENRAEIMKKLEANNMDSRPCLYPISEMPMYHDLSEFPISKELSKKGINLPSSVNLKKEEIELIARIINSI